MVGAIDINSRLEIYSIRGSIMYHDGCILGGESCAMSPWRRWSLPSFGMISQNILYTGACKTVYTGTDY